MRGRSLGSVGAAAWVALILALTAAPAAAEPVRIGQIKTASGDATILRDGARVPARPGDPVFLSDVVETGPDGSIGITLVDNSVLSNGPGSRLELREFSFDVSSLQGNMLAELRKGTLSIVSGDITHHSPGAMRIMTPTATLAVRGTTFAVKVR